MRIISSTLLFISSIAVANAFTTSIATSSRNRNSRGIHTFPSSSRIRKATSESIHIHTSSQIMMSDSSSNSNSDSNNPTSGDVVTVTYSLTPNGDFVTAPLFNDGTVSFVLDGGNYLPGLHAIVSKMVPGETQSDVNLDAGWGERRDELIAKVPIASSGISPSDLKVGMELFLANGMQCKVVDLDEENFTIDANPPLAGASYNAKVTLDSFSSGPSEAQFGYSEHITEDSSSSSSNSSPFQVLTIALGCFWGGELEYQRVDGVVGTAVGYTQGEKENPEYKEVCSGTTGHTEAIQVIFDPSIVSYEELVQIGMERLGESRYLPNQVGNDRGTQYRHGVYYHNDGQKEIATRVIASYGDKCVTECMEAKKFYKAEDYHQQYLLKGGQSARKNASDTIRCYG